MYFMRQGGHCIGKKLPDCESITLAYDHTDRLLFEQNGVQKGKKRWTVYKYDVLGRLLYSFEHTDATPVATLRERLKNICVEERDSGTDNLGIAIQTLPFLGVLTCS